MPRETISHGKPIYYVLHKSDLPGGAEWEEEYDATSFPEGKDVEGHTPSRYPDLEVLWSRAGDSEHLPVGEEAQGWVQIGLDMPRAEWERSFKEFERSPDLLARAVFSQSLTRGQINHMIRTLKRARDAAFGADE